MNKKILSVLAISAALSSLVFAQTDSTDTSALFDDTAAADTAAAAPAGTDAGGFEALLWGTHTLDLKLPAYDWDSYGTYTGALAPSLSNLINLTVKAGDVKFVSEWTVTASTADDGTQNLGLSASAGENAIYWAPGNFRFGAGWQYFSWGVADKQNPTDNLNARDYTGGITADKIPALALSATWYPVDSLSVQGVFKPLAESSLFGVDFAGQVQSGVNTFDAGFNAVFVPYGLSPISTAVTTSDLDASPENFVAGGRVAFTSTVVDLSASYLYDWDRYYSPTVTLSANALGRYYPSAITLEKKRIHRIGLDAKTTLDKLGLWLEAAYNVTEDYLMESDATRNPNLDWTLGADLSFGPSDSFYANLQYLGSWIPGYDSTYYQDYTNGSPDATKLNDQAYMQRYFDRSLAQKLGGQTEGLLQGAALNLKFPMADDVLTPSLTGAYLVPFYYDDTLETRLGSLALNPELDIMPVDSFHIKLGAQLYYAWVQPKDGQVQLDTANDRVGRFTPDNKVYLSISYSWNYSLKK